MVFVHQVPTFKYALERINHDNPSRRYRDEMSVNFRQDYLKNLPKEVIDRLQEGKMTLPLVVVEEHPGSYTICEIDIPAFLATQ